jgi:hypothetical protein
MQLTTDTACNCLLCPTVFSRQAGKDGRGAMTEAATLLCEACWNDMRRYYIKQFYPDHVLAFVTHVEAIRAKEEAAGQAGVSKTDPCPTGSRPADPSASGAAR